MMAYTYDYFMKSADYIKGVIGDFRPETGLILGSGLSGFADSIENPVTVSYKDIPNFLVSTAPSHKGELIFGTLEGKKLVCMAGRFHFYEGYSWEQLQIPVRVLALLGIRNLILTNAAGAVNENYHIGDIMIIKDHIKMTGASPMCGPNISEFGPRFFDTSNMYDKDLQALALECSKDCDLTFRKGVYMFMTGPQYETPAEIRAIRALGADAVGMSTVTEALTACHCGIPVLGFSVISNMAAGVSDVKLTEQDVIDTANKVAPKFRAYVRDVIRRMP